MDRRAFVEKSLLAPLALPLASHVFGASGRILDPSRWGADGNALGATGFIGFTPPVFPGPRSDEARDPGTAGYYVNLANDGRADLVYRVHAQMHDARRILVNATMVSAGIVVTAHSGLMTAIVPPNPAVAARLAQLAVTGRAAFDSFAAWHPQDADLLALVRAANPTFKDQAALSAAASRMLDVAYDTLWTIRSNDAGWRARRPQLGWIATSGEDDLPHRPVNITTAPYPQYDMAVDVRGDLGNVRVLTRYMVAAASTSLAGSAPRPTPAPGSVRTLPPITPALPPTGDILIFIHGGSSRVEEGVGLAEHLMEAGKAKGKTYTVISVDLPNSGYSAPFAHTAVAPPQSTFHQDHGHGYVPQDNNRDIYGFPIMSFEERFIINFIEGLDRQFGNVKPRIAAVMGGSLGGNMSLQLARRKDKYPYLRTIVAWSPTCFKAPDGPTRMMIGAPMGGNLINLFQAPEQDNTRHEYMTTLFDKPLSALFGMPPQPQMWYGYSFPDRNDHITRSRLDHYEYYTPQHRQWTTRLNYEMTQFTFHEGDVYKDTDRNKDTQEGPVRYLTMSSKLLLAAGAEDDYNQVRNYSETMRVAPMMGATPGTTLFLLQTGHSIHDERPRFFAKHIVDFLT